MVIYINVYIIRNGVGITALIVLFYILFTFYSGTALYVKLEGRWVSIEYSDEYIFMDRNYSHESGTGIFRIRGNKIIFFPSGKEFFYVLTMIK